MQNIHSYHLTSKVKIYRKCVIDIETMSTIEEDYYYYDGPIARCKGGGGGGSSGAVDYPTYMKDVHNDWLDNTGIDKITSSITDAMNSALSTSPWTGQVAYDPDDDISAYIASLANFRTILSGLNDTANWASFYDQSNAKITDSTEDDIIAYGNILDDQLTINTLPRFKRGMQDINAVVSSSFVIGESVIEGFRDRDVAKYAADIRLSRQQQILNGVDQIINIRNNRLGLEDSYVKTYIEAMRIKIVAKKEESDKNIDIDEQDALWDLEVFQYGANVMASIQGGTVSNGPRRPSTAASVLGGALSGAAAGAMIGSTMAPAGGLMPMAIGAVLGAATGFL
jgi:hypothetical protein